MYMSDINIINILLSCCSQQLSGGEADLVLLSVVAGAVEDNLTTSRTASSATKEKEDEVTEDTDLWLIGDIFQHPPPLDS